MKDIMTPSMLFLEHTNEVEVMILLLPFPFRGTKRKIGIFSRIEFERNEQICPMLAIETTSGFFWLTFSNLGGSFYFHQNLFIILQRSRKNESI
mmetsp:Transcript_21365/g.43123  ORF Transcript_21365/g.43123 Transcript_21365/m.43123 type:complete len:94 (-) Transcript_21365:254-535(-)